MKIWSQYLPLLLCAPFLPRKLRLNGTCFTGSPVKSCDASGSAPGVSQPLCTSSGRSFLEEMSPFLSVCGSLFCRFCALGPWTPEGLGHSTPVTPNFLFAYVCLGSDSLAQVWSPPPCPPSPSTGVTHSSVPHPVLHIWFCGNLTLLLALQMIPQPTC